MSTLHPNSIRATMNPELLKSHSFQTDKASLNPALTTPPPPKRRRGRPPKIPEYPNVSPAAHSSAAVVKQGTPNAGSPLMRISPLGKRNSLSSSPLQKFLNPSPKGGLLMKLTEEVATDKKRKYSPRSARSKVSKPKTAATKTAKIPLNAQHNTETLTQKTPPTNSEHSSVNPSLLLSSPITSVSSAKILEISKARQPESKRRVDKSKMHPPPIPSNFPSSPKTPASVPSSFSSIIQSSPLYQGYYANLSSPGTSLMSSSPIKYQMKPIELPDLKRYSNELPKNPVNSPDLRPQSREYKPPQLQSSNKHYKVSLSIDEFGQATITKVKSTTSVPTVKSLKHLGSSPMRAVLSSPAQPRPRITRHESLMNITHHSFNSPRSQSLSQDYDMFIDPMKIPNDPFFIEIGDHLPFEQHVFKDQFNLSDDVTSSSDEGKDLEDEDMKYDARKALIKMIRRSV